MLAADLRHLLIHRDGVAMRRADLGAGQEDVDAVVVVPETAGMVQAADGRDHVAEFLQRLERAREGVVLTWLGDLIIQ